MTPEQAIAATVAAWGSGDPSALIRIAERESRLQPQARGDADAAPEAFRRVQADLAAAGNRWAYDPSRWSHSFGLYQLMPAYYARLWDPKADPYSLFNPQIATVVAARLWNRAVRAGADDFVRVRLFWANPFWVDIPATDPRYQDRLDKWSIVNGQLNPRVEHFDYRAFGFGPQVGQSQRLRGTEIPTATNWPAVVSWSILAWKLWRKYGEKR